MEFLRCKSEWENTDRNNRGLLFERCPVCGTYIYHRDKTKINAGFIKETGYMDKTIYMQCLNCKNYLYY